MVDLGADSGLEVPLLVMGRCTFFARGFVRLALAVIFEWLLGVARLDGSAGSESMRDELGPTLTALKLLVSGMPGSLTPWFWSGGWWHKTQVC